MSKPAFDEYRQGMYLTLIETAYPWRWIGQLWQDVDGLWRWRPRCGHANRPNAILCRKCRSYDPLLNKRPRFEHKDAAVSAVVAHWRGPAGKAIRTRSRERAAEKS